VRPDPKINKVVQNRFSEKNFLKFIGITTTEFALLKSKNDIEKNKNLLPGILKTLHFLVMMAKDNLSFKPCRMLKRNGVLLLDYILEKFINLKTRNLYCIT
jgi:5-(carboxyamino)imidazole ribonucleotide synthase